ncbi:MAG: GIN domain-containing protein [Dehalococcoidia bacterium]
MVDGRSREAVRNRVSSPAAELAVLVVLVVVAAACGGGGPDHVVPSGIIETQTVDLADFTTVTAGGAFQLELTLGDTFEVEVSADDNLLPLVEVERHGEALDLGIKGRVSIDGNATLKAAIQLPALRGLHLDGASRATLNGFREPEGVEIEASGASFVGGELSAGTLTAVLSGASRVSLEGFALSGDLTASGASRLELLRFDLASAVIDVSGASYAEVSVRDEITRAKASGASTIVYKGGADVGKLDVSGASSVSEY